MTEVPEHLLRRAKERRAAASGEAAPEGKAEASASKAVEPAKASTPQPGGSGGAPVPATPGALEPPYTGPPPAPPRKERVPAWAMPVLVALPLWAILYGGAFGERATVGHEGPLPLGANVYRAQGCSGCHGPTGGGGVGPAMDGVIQTFPEFADHVEWIRTGSAPFKGQPYGATGKVATGGMPGYPELSEEEVIAVVCHERVTLAGGEIPPECEEGAAGTGEDPDGDDVEEDSGGAGAPSGDH